MGFFRHLIRENAKTPTLFALKSILTLTVAATILQREYRLSGI